MDLIFILMTLFVGQWVFNMLTGKKTDWNVLGATACKGIEDDIELDCDYPITGGVNDRLILFNHADIEGATRDPLNSRIVTSISLKSGARGYVVEGKNSSNEPSTNFVKKTYTGAWEHVMDFKVFRNDPVVKKNVENLGKGKVVALVQNNFVNSNGNSVFELYGFDSGLELETATRATANEDLLGAWEISLKSNAKALEAAPPLTFYNTSYVQTKADVEALIV